MYALSRIKASAKGLTRLAGWYTTMMMGEREDAVQSRLYDALLEKIISGELAPGTRLIEDDLAREYQTSRTPVREVLFVFEKDGLVERTRNRGARVKVFGAEDVDELFDIRKILETFCVTRMGTAPCLPELMQLRQRLIALEGKSGKAWRDEQIRIDLDLHALIVANCGNHRLTAHLNNLSMLIRSLQTASHHRAISTETVRQTGRQHFEIIQALIMRDVDSAQRLLAEHIEYGKRNTMELFMTPKH